MSIPDKEMIKKCLGSESRMHTLQKNKKLRIYVEDILSTLNFTGALDVKKFVEENSVFLEKEVFHVDGFTTKVEYRPGSGNGKRGNAKPRVLVTLTNS
jgi:hypothetical protein